MNCDKTDTWMWSHDDSHTVTLPIALNNLKGYVEYFIYRYTQMISDNVYDQLWAIYRQPQGDIEDKMVDGFISEWNGKVGIICGSGLSCAIGLPDLALFKDEEYEKCQKICERDFENLKEGKDIILISDPEFIKANMGEM